jgi:hypothetical protein
MALEAAKKSKKIKKLKLLTPSSTLSSVLSTVFFLGKKWPIVVPKSMTAGLLGHFGAISAKIGCLSD